LQAKNKWIANCGPLNDIGSRRQRATGCKLQAICMPVEVVGKEQRIANLRAMYMPAEVVWLKASLIVNCRQFERQLKW